MVSFPPPLPLPPPLLPGAPIRSHVIIPTGNVEYAYDRKICCRTN